VLRTLGAERHLKMGRGDDEGLELRGMNAEAEGQLCGFQGL
jgi:hypothetical protein